MEAFMLLYTKIRLIVDGKGVTRSHHQRGVKMRPKELNRQKLSRAFSAIFPPANLVPAL